jgi:hemolysin III
MAEKIKTYTPREERLNALSHIAGVLFAFAVIYPLYKLCVKVDSRIFTAGVIFYWFAFLAMFGASSFYHLCKDQWRKILARKFDHSAIYLLITGTYAPLITGAVRTPGGYAVMVTLCVLTFLGIAGKIFFANKFHFLEVIIYVAMGWACVFIAGDLLASMSKDGLWLLLYGGIAYTGGVVFYVVRKEFFHALWHVFVLLGAVLQFFSILTIA